MKASKIKPAASKVHKRNPKSGSGLQKDVSKRVAKSSGTRNSKSKRTEEEEEDDELESKYLEKYSKNDEEDDTEEEAKKAEDSSADESDEEEVAATIVEDIDLKETELEKADRTIFVGNLSNQVMLNKKNKKAFEQKFKEFGEIESIRFRSIAFSEQVPKKVAFIQKKFDEFKDTVNAYVVYKEKEAVTKALAFNGEVYLDHHLRIDSVSHPLKKENNRSIFIGNLDFFEVEESLWQFFEDCGKIEYVRIVRDPKTNIGKGFAYVQFVDAMSVSKALLLNGKELKTSKAKKKRTLRISRCKKSVNDKKVLADRRSLKNLKLTDKQKTKLGRAQAILGKKDRNDVGKFIIEGNRAQEGKGVSVKNGKIKKPRAKKPRYSEREKKQRSKNSGDSK